MQPRIAVLHVIGVLLAVAIASAIRAEESQPEWTPEHALKQYQSQLVYDPNRAATTSRAPLATDPNGPQENEIPEPEIAPVDVAMGGVPDLIPSDFPSPDDRLNAVPNPYSGNPLSSSGSDPCCPPANESNWLAKEFSLFGTTWNKHLFTTSVIPASQDGVGFTSLEIGTQIFPNAFPLLRVSPRFAWHFVDRPDSIDLPANVYDTAVDVALFLPFNKRWSFFGGLAPGLYTDFDNMSSDAFRLIGRVLFFYKRSEFLKYAFGFVYLDREDISALPAVGAVWTPESAPNLTFEIMFPKPRIKYVLEKCGEAENFVYLGGELGGGTWAIQERNGRDTIVTYNDLKLALGYEKSNPEGLTWFLETAYVFDRSLEYPDQPEVDLSNSGMVRVGLKY
ncbi:hypothetical protein KOR42_21690 [Thalassoglobus neptunius]|uniref:DUF6268 domain-containing protein n=1 Tax=Thalassoglobus neptunius TaxID=1938619 RepID=A0A5C5X906_9PLAN|nr:DUF6268 family outer membrane beta-barrel protein [Thalassoglobus neptunius]TWT58783.1 hypothetical protein KOR42_21690 [Thalassoglobus neptunius]